METKEKDVVESFKEENEDKMDISSLPLPVSEDSLHVSSAIVHPSLSSLLAWPLMFTPAELS